MDESGCHLGIESRRGWSRKSQRLFGPEQTYARRNHVSMLAALRRDGICAKTTVRGRVKGPAFRRFMLHKRIPTLRKGDVVVWDHLNLHNNQPLQRAIKKAGAKVLFLPNYGPNINPIEAAWAKVKHWIRKQGTNEVSKLRKLMRRGLSRICPKDAQGWFKYCGYHPQP